MDDYSQRVLFAFGRLEDQGIVALRELDVVVLRELSSPDALAAVERENLDLCVIWGAGPEAAGLLREIRGSSKGAVMPILLVGMEGGHLSDETTALEMGADSFVQEESGEEAVLDKITTLLGLATTASIPPVVPPEAIYQKVESPRKLQPEDEDSLEELKTRDASDPISSALLSARKMAQDQSADMGSSARGDAPRRDIPLSEIIAEAERKVAPMASSSDPSMNAGSDEIDSLEVDSYVEKPDPQGGSVEKDNDPAVEEGSDTDGDDVAQTQPLERVRGAESEPPVSAPSLPTVGLSALDAEGGEGSLGRERLWCVVATLLKGKFTGTLILSSRGIERRIIVDGGELTMATSTARDDRLIELLHREGRLTERQYEQAAMTIGASGRRAGAVLVEKGLIASRELFPLERHHYEALIFDSFTWVEGTWRFRPGKPSTSERILLDLSTASIVMEGMRSRATLEDIQELAPFGGLPHREDDGLCPLQDTGLSQRELELLDWCDGTRGTVAIAERFDLSQSELGAILSGLVVLGWISMGGGKSGAVSPLGALPGKGGGVPAGYDLMVERARVGDKFFQVDEGTYFALMEVPPDASGYDIRKSYRRLRGLFAPERFAVDELADLRSQAEVIRVVLDEAYEILRNSARREAYRAARGEGG